jgi:hypothetical protein
MTLSSHEKKLMNELRMESISDNRQKARELMGYVVSEDELDAEIIRLLPVARGLVSNKDDKLSVEFMATAMLVGELKSPYRGMLI